MDEWLCWGGPAARVLLQIMDAEQLCAAANAQGLTAASEKGSGAQCSPHALTISWPDASG